MYIVGLTKNDMLKVKYFFSFFKQKCIFYSDKWFAKFYIGRVSIFILVLTIIEIYYIQIEHQCKSRTGKKYMCIS